MKDRKVANPVTMDEFSFPTFATDTEPAVCRLPFTHFASSPMWFISSSAEDSTENVEETKCCNGISFAEDIKKSNEAVLTKHDEEDSLLLGDGDKRAYVSDEERMDMLWEDFNEELYGIDYKGMMVNKHNSKAEEHGVVELCCVQPLGATKSSGSIIHRNRASLLMLMKVIKKLLLIQKTDSSRKSSIC